MGFTHVSTKSLRPMGVPICLDESGRTLCSELCRTRPRWKAVTTVVYMLPIIQMQLCVVFARSIGGYLAGWLL